MHLKQKYKKRTYLTLFNKIIKRKQKTKTSQKQISNRVGMKTISYTKQVCRLARIKAFIYIMTGLGGLLGKRLYDFKRLVIVTRQWSAIWKNLGTGGFLIHKQKKRITTFLLFILGWLFLFPFFIFVIFILIFSPPNKNQIKRKPMNILLSAPDKYTKYCKFR